MILGFHYRGAREPAPKLMLLVSFITCYLAFSIEEATAAKKTETNYYSIHGSSHAELNQEMAQKGPKGFAGYTASSIRYSYSTTEVGPSCRITKLDIDYTLTYTMPRWENSEAADPALQQWWKQYHDALWEHERNHGRIADQRYSKVQSKLSALGRRPTCAEFEPLVRQEYTEIALEFAAKQAQYDQITQHGRTEMPVFHGAPQPPVAATPQQLSAAGLIKRNWLWVVLGGLVALRWVRA